MKVLILSLPRSFSLSLQTAISRSLGSGNQLHLVAPDVEYPHLNDMLHFNEANLVARDHVTKRSHLVQLHRPDLTYYSPVWESSTKAVLRGTSYQQYIDYATIDKELQTLERSQSDWVLRLFPTLFRTSRFKLSLAEQRMVMSRLLAAADLVIPLLRMNMNARVTSVFSAMMYGGLFNVPIRPEARRLKYNEETFVVESAMERAFRALCVDYSLTPIWAESLLRGGFERRCTEWGLPQVPFLNVNPGYSVIEEQSVDVEFSKTFCPWIPRNAQTEYDADPVYSALLRAKLEIRKSAPGFLGVVNGEDKWRTQADFDAFVSATGPGGIINARLRERTIEIRRTQDESSSSIA